jgi:hypothetical protein
MSIDATKTYNAIQVNIPEEDITIKVSAGQRGPVGFEYIGEYSASTVYYHTNSVKYNNTLYIALPATPAGGMINIPPTNSTYWGLMLSSTGPFTDIASQAEAEAGTDNTKGMTPLRTAQAIDTISTLDGIDWIDFDTTAGAAGQEGRVFWDADDSTLAFQTTFGNTQQTGQELWGIGKNLTGGTATDGSVVYANGVSGNRLTYDYADARTGSKCGFVGVVTASTLSNNPGPVTTFGYVRNMNTSSWTPGTKLYIAADATGTLTSTAPSAPNFIVWVATVTNQHATQGEIFVSPRIDFSNGVTFHSLALNSELALTLGSDAEGDLWYRNSSGVFTRLGIGTAGQYLTVNSGATAPEWITNLPANADLTIGHTTNNSTATTCTALNTYYPLAGTWTEHHTENMTTTPASGTITVSSGFNGDYQFVADLSMVASRSSVIVCFSFLKNGSYIAGSPRIRRKIGTAADVGACSVSAVFHDLVATDYVQCAVQLISGEGTNTAGDSVTIENGQVRATYLRS